MILSCRIVYAFITTIVSVTHGASSNTRCGSLIEIEICFYFNGTKFSNENNPTPFKPIQILNYPKNMPKRPHSKKDIELNDPFRQYVNLTNFY